MQETWWFLVDYNHIHWVSFPKDLGSHWSITTVHGRNLAPVGSIVYPITYDGFHSSQVVIAGFWTINSCEKSPRCFATIRQAWSSTSSHGSRSTTSLLDRLVFQILSLWLSRVANELENCHWEFPCLKVMQSFKAKAECFEHRKTKISFRYGEWGPTRTLAAKS